MAVEIRAAEIPEAGAIIARYEWLFEPPGYRPPRWDEPTAERALKEAIEDPAAAVLVAAEGEDLAGFCTAYLDLNSVRFGLRCWVEDLAVDPDRRSRGVGAALLGAAKSWARTRGATHLELDSGIARSDAHRFYEREQPSWTGMQYAWLL